MSREQQPRYLVRGSRVAIAIVAALLVYPVTAVSAPPPPLSFPLSVNEDAVLDANGDQVDLRGVQIAGMVRGAGNDRTRCNYHWRQPKKSWSRIIASMGFNTIRLGISWANLEPAAPTLEPDGTISHAWNWTYIDAIDKTIDHYRAHGVAVILDMHQSQWSPAFFHFRPNPNRFVCEGAGMPMWLYPDTPTGQTPAEAKCEFYRNTHRQGVPVAPQDGYTEAWKFLALRYKDTPNVAGADLLAEPWAVRSCGDDLPADTVDELFFRIGSAVRTVNPNMLLIYQNGTWRNFVVGGPLLTHKLNLPNAVYSWHWYPPDWNATVIPGANPSTGMQLLAANFAIAQDYAQPFWLGEFNAFNQGYDHAGRHTDPNWQADLAEAMAYMKENHIGWSFFAWSNGSGSSLFNKRTNQVKPELTEGLKAGL